ncbi:hypothetical protein [Planomonospora parontospora]|uniref:hypothetical protein n=1 Tax=Planomonospora parontospora TaxID=58119 RepID=UPI00166FD012|nr:hypothetical protein [Planomonospora parontospora]GGL16665.1 hypothetical protein GCM10014719_18540 [Planomonospora parontospora subsp. antibiotica]GII15335.1 hypothetical protein Ppa05_20610 [Planomonospora parontospora subsp. antibiotica]
MNRARLTALSLAAGGVLFLLYQAVRPYADETALEGAAAMASPAWVAAHLCAVAGFVLVASGLLGLHLAPGARLGLPPVVTFWIGTGLVLPYYGAETFGLNVIGARAVHDRDATLLELVDRFRFAPVPAAMFLTGLVLLAAGAIVVAVRIRRSGAGPRWSGVPLAAGFVLFVPQFYGTPAMRVAHGALLAAGGLWLAYDLWRAGDGDRTRPPGRSMTTSQPRIRS